MVSECMRRSRKRKGESFEDIENFIEGTYNVNVKKIKYHTVNFVEKQVDLGSCEEVMHEMVRRF